MGIQMTSLLPIQDLEYDDYISLNLSDLGYNDYISLNLSDLQDQPVTTNLQVLIDSSVVQVFIKEGRSIVYSAPIYESSGDAVRGGVLNRRLYFDYNGVLKLVNGRISFNFNLKSIYSLIRRIW